MKNQEDKDTIKILEDELLYIKQNIRAEKDEHVKMAFLSFRRKAKLAIEELKKK